MTAEPASERFDSLPWLLLLWFALLAPPTAWMLHLSLEYFLVTLQCQLHGGDAGLYMALVTTGAALFCVAGGGAGFLLWRRLGEREQTRSVSRARFMALSAVVLSVLFLVGVILGTVPVYTLEQCNVIQ